MSEYGIELTETLNLQQYQAIILTVAHNEYSHLNLEQLDKSNVVIFDTKSILDKEIVDGRL